MALGFVSNAEIVGMKNQIKGEKMPNKALTFLSKLGQIILEGTQIFLGVAPFVGKFAPTSAGTLQVVSKDLVQVADAIAQAEAFGQALSLPGAQKLQAAIGPVQQIILDSSILAGKKVQDPALLKRGCQKVADGMADILNSLHPDAVQTTSTQNAAPAPNMTPSPTPNV